MDIYSHFEGIAEKYKNIVVALGNFDGLHKGHQKLISELVKKSEEIGGTPAVFTFFPHPLEVLNPKQSPPLLMQKEEKIAFLRKLGVKLIIFMPFDMTFAELTPEEFIKDILIEKLNVKGVFVGYNYNFGHKGKGNASLLKTYGEKYNFLVEVIQPFNIDGYPVSSTRIRRLLLDGEIQEATKLLGYYPYLKGIVVHGEKRGRTIGFPTANLQPESNTLVPSNGVYAVKVYVNDISYYGVCNIGYKPTFHPDLKEKTIEINILDFNENIYNAMIKVEFIKHLRGEKKFSSLDDLVKQINIDVENAKCILKGDKLA